MHITLTGNLGSGKSSICRLLESEYGFEIYSTGVVQRELAKERGISVYEMNEIMRKDPSYDNMIDERTTLKSKEDKSKNIVFDSRLAWHFALDTFKVFLSVNINEAAKRVFNDSRRGEVEKYTSIENAKEYLIKRAEGEDIRYHEIYNLDYFNFSNYDLILDSTYNTQEELVKVLLTEAKNFNEAKEKGLAPSKRVLFSTTRLGFPTNTSITPPNYCSQNSVVLTKGEEDYIILEGIEEVKKAASEGYPFINAIIK